MTAAAPGAPATAERKERKRQTILVSIPGWPNQDPGRQMIYGWRPSSMKAKKFLKELREKMPEYEWDLEPLTATQTRTVKLKGFNLREDIRRRRGVVTG